MDLEDQDPFSVPPSGPLPQRTTGGNVLWTPPTPEHMARMLPQYDEWRTLGQGGMGVVYQARQTNLDRTVAIKILPPEAADDEAQFIERFKNEARTMAKMNHPAIVHVHDFGETSDGQLYFAMEFVDGTDVAKLIKEQGKLPPKHALAIAAHVCDALQYAHTHGVMHRDIKPANVLINMEGAVKVADFGLAKMDDPTGSVGLTKSGTTMGTPDFVAPEALDLGTVADHRADLYAVGVMLYQMLTGRIPRGMAQPPSVLAPEIDPRFDAIVQKAMQHDREERYQSALEIRHALDEILTVPIAQVDAEGKSRAASQSQNVFQRPVARGPQLQPRPTLSHSRMAVAPPKSKTPLFIGLGAIALLAVAAYFKLKPEGKSEVPSKLEVKNPTPENPVPPVSPDPAQPDPLSKPDPSIAASPTVPPPDTELEESDTPNPAPSPALPAELAELDGQFQKLQAERVTGVFETDVAKLNTGYLGALDREIAKGKTAGNLDGILILALEAEKKRTTDKLPVPDKDDEKTSAGLKTLRATYRTAHAKLTASRNANLKALTDPLDKRLVQLEGDFTKANRLEDAKVVRSYREALGEAQNQSDSAFQPVLTLKPAANLGLRNGFTNMLGMKFVPVKGTDVLFCIHETRYKDYAAYAKETQGLDVSWKDQSGDGFTPNERLEDHPVIKVSWDDAQSFCAWLSKKTGRLYRLPTDLEWSIAAGMGRDEKGAKDANPSNESEKEITFPWGDQWPPPKDSGNYADRSLGRGIPKFQASSPDTYDDGYTTTAPVMSFKPNKSGLYDLGGNVWEWCEDWYDVSKTRRVLRGASYYDSGRQNLLSSRRDAYPPITRYGTFGFRCVVEVAAPDH